MPSIPICPVTGQRSLSLVSHTRIPISFPCGRPARGRAEIGAYPVPLKRRWKFRCRLYPGELNVLAEQWRNVQTAHEPFGQASQHLWLVPSYGDYHRFTCVHLASEPCPLPHDARSFASPSRVLLHPGRDRSTLSGWLQTWPLPATPAPLGYCRRNGRFRHMLM
jgi:hypothetical protein